MDTSDAADKSCPRHPSDLRTTTTKNRLILIAEAPRARLFGGADCEETDYILCGHPSLSLHQTERSLLPELSKANQQQCVNVCASDF